MSLGTRQSIGFWIFTIRDVKCPRLFQKPNGQRLSSPTLLLNLGSGFGKDRKPYLVSPFSQNGTDKIHEILQDTSIDMYVRWAASGAYIHLVRDGTITRDTAVAQLHEHLVQCMAKEDYELIAPIICKLTDLAATVSIAFVVTRCQC